MKVIIDERETALYDKCYSIVHTEGNVTNIQLIKKVIPLGDILFTTDEDKPVNIIERKSLPDLLASIKDGRYEEQSHRLLHASGFPPHNIVYLIEGSTSLLRSNLEKRIVYSSITSLNFFKGFSVLRTNGLQETAELIVWMADKIERDFLKGKIPSYLRQQIAYTNAPVQGQVQVQGQGQVEGEPVNEPVEDSTPGFIQSNYIIPPPPNYSHFVKKVKKDNITPQNIGEIMLSQIPGISSITAIAIMKPYATFSEFLVELQTNPDCLKNIMCESGGKGFGNTSSPVKTRKISKAVVESIKSYILGHNTSLAPRVVTVVESVTQVNDSITTTDQTPDTATEQSPAPARPKSNRKPRMRSLPKVKDSVSGSTKTKLPAALIASLE